jgi:ribosome-associated toxin RatA of RatAB toxin-antitoxin module
MWTILVNEKMTMQSSKYSSFLNPKWKKIQVKYITLKEYLQKNNIEIIDVLKMDIEWMEFEVLDSRWDFEREKVDNLIVEIHILNKEMEEKWNQIFLKIKNIFSNVEVFEWWYRKEIFLLRANKKPWL